MMHSFISVATALKLLVLFVDTQGNLRPKRRRAILDIFNKMDTSKSGQVSTEELGVHYNSKGDPDVEEGRKSGKKRKDIRETILVFLKR